MFHPHLKKICALFFLFIGGMPVFAMEEGEGRPVFQSTVHLKGSNIEFNNALTSPVPVLIEDDGDFRTSAVSSLKAPIIDVVSESVDLQGSMEASDTISIKGQGAIIINGSLKATKLVVIGGEHIENFETLGALQPESFRLERIGELRGDFSAEPSVSEIGEILCVGRRFPLE